jgi:hypothetical protein
VPGESRAHHPARGGDPDELSARIPASASTICCRLSTASATSTTIRRAASTSRRISTRPAGLLDLIRHTLEQLHDDAFPDAGAAPRLCQDWTLPYLAELVAARLRAPFPERPAGRGGERRALGAAQGDPDRDRGDRRGDPADRGAGPGGLAARGDHGPASTGRSPPPARWASPQATPPDAAADPGWTHQDAARHPGLPAATVDFRAASRAVKGRPGAPATRPAASSVAGPIWPLDDADPRLTPNPVPPRPHWRQLAPHGAPCFPGVLRGRLGPHRRSALSRARPAARPLTIPVA